MTYFKLITYILCQYISVCILSMCLDCEWKVFSERFIWWAWAGFAERWDDSYTPPTLHLLPFVCLPSVRARVKHSLIKHLVWVFFMPWDGKVWSKSLFKGWRFTCRASWKCPPAVIFCVDNRHANTAAVFFQSLTLVCQDYITVLCQIGNKFG